MIRLIDRSFQLTPGDVADSLEGVDWASVDHTRNAHVILEIRRRDGRHIWGLGWWVP